MNQLYDQFDGPKWINFSGADYLSDNDEFSMIFFGVTKSPKVSTKWYKKGQKEVVRKFKELGCKVNFEHVVQTMKLLNLQNWTT